MRQADCIIIGAGPGGYETAAALAAAGKDVVLVERDSLGGTCLNRGCIPTKCLCASANIIADIRRADAFGVSVASFTADYGKAHARIADVTSQLRAGIESLLAKVTVVKGTASLEQEHVVVVDDERLTAPQIIIATGSKPAIPPIEGAGLAVTSDDFLNLDDIPQRVAIIGGGVIGIEFASVLNDFGRDVTVIEYCPEILPAFDKDIAKRLRTALGRRGIRFMVSTAVTAIRPGFEIDVKGRKGDDRVSADLVVMATGRRPVIPQGTAEAGIELDGRGFIKVDDLMQTSVEGIFAIGDVNGRCMLAHAAEAQGRRAIGSDVNLDIIPSAVFCHPEAAMVGMTEDSAWATDRNIVVGKASYAANGKALATGEEGGTVKLVVDRDSGFILGCHVLGAHASDIVAEAAALMFGMTTAEELADELVHNHPTLSEVLPAAARDVVARLTPPAI